MFFELSTSYPQVIHRLSTIFLKMDAPFRRWVSSKKEQVIHKKYSPLLLLIYIYIIYEEKIISGIQNLKILEFIKTYLG
jgi:hypothetical protein